ncbi:MAG: hypothetical protein R3A47_03805 [Polyangiales bacterium]
MTQTLEGSADRRAVVPFRAKLTAIGATVAVVPLSAVGFALLEIGGDTVQTMSQD